MSRYAEIIGRLQKATGPDRTLGRDIYFILDNAAWKAAYQRAQEPSGCPHHLAVIGAELYLPHVTSSIDKAVDLAESIVATEGRKLICFFCAGGQLTSHNTDETSPDYHPKAKIDNSVTAGWMAHIRFYSDDGTSVGADDYSHAKTAPLAILLSLFKTLEAKEAL